ncbi:urea ABC transporter permease subunit UrtB [Oceanisphaera psychrotolerans]|nr:urea ABC transporter permease subunit UrtB [Oceanisphaera psychrotolerans]
MSGLLLGLMLSVLTVSPVLAASLQEGLEHLAERDFDAISTGVSLIAASGDEQAATLLKELQQGELYRDKSSDQIVRIVAEVDGGYRVAPVTDSSAGYEVNKRGLRKVRINNSLRSQIRSALAELELRHPDADIRKRAVGELLGQLDADSTALLTRLQAQEPDAGVREAMATALALGQLQGDDPEAQREAIKTLAGSLEPQVRNALLRVRDQSQDTELVAAADKALALIEEKARLYGFAETLFFGLSLGSVLVLAAIGLAITFGVMGVINMAHGELIMLGAYTTYVIQLLMPDQIGLSLFVAIPAAFLVSALVGIAIERGVIRFLYGRPLETLLATFGISLVLQQTVRSIFSPLNRSVATPEWMSGSLEINPLLSLTLNRLYIILFCLIVFALLFMVLRRTRLGLQVRAVSQNRAMARAMGVRSEWVDAMTFGLGSGIAGVAGVALSQLTNVGPNLGQAYIIDSFMVVVFGGVGNLWGTLVAGMSLGVANKVLEPYAGAVLAKILVLVFIILFIQKRPRGLFPQKGRAAEG